MPLHICQTCNKEFFNSHKDAKCCSRACHLIRKTKHPAPCHPDRIMLAKGLCASCYAKQVWRTRDHRAKQARNFMILKKFGITPEQWDKIYKMQNGLCPICGDKLNLHRDGSNKRAAAVDHDHDSGRVRGITCHQCNRNRIGINTLETAYKLVEYLSSSFDGRII